MKGATLEVIGAIQHRRRRQQRKMLGAFGQKTIEKDLVEPLRCENRLRDARWRVLIEIDIGRAVGQVEIGKNGFGRKKVRNAPGAIVRDSRGTAAALGADKGQAAPQRTGVGIDEIDETADRISGIATGATIYSEMPLRMRSR